MTDPLQLEAMIARCAEEPIHTPGSVQPHGSVLGIDEDGQIVVASANSASMLKLDATTVLGTTLEHVFGDAAAAIIAARDGTVILVNARNDAWEMVTRRAGALRLVEVEPAPAEVVDTSARIHTALRAFHGATTVEELAAQAARAVQELTNFDRVLVYRFDPDWNGEVIAEVVRPGHQHFVGLRFPASDIPPQARALYSRARLRLIPDANATPSALVGLDEQSATSLDLSDVALRAVSPVHLQYLRNMGVTASMSVAIHVGDRLWGLIACHHLIGPLRPSLQVRDAVDIVGRTTSTILAAFLGAAVARNQVALHARVDAISESLWSERSRDPNDVLVDLGEVFSTVFDSTGGAVVSGSRVRLVGECPPESVVAGLVARARAADSSELRVEELAALEPEWSKHAAVAAGAMVVPVDGLGDRWLVWFRPETRVVIRWGGNPDGKETATDDDGRMHLNPRSSFEEYLELVRGRSLPWTDEQLSAARTLAHRLTQLHAERTQRRAEAAAVIQRTILLEAFPNIPNMAGAARYQPSAGSLIGGDWYDVFFGREGRAILAIGDVAGHGVEAAATMAQLRHALRAYVLRENTPAEAMSRLNDLMMSLLPDEMATALLVELDPIGHTVEIVNAGHLPPIIVGPDGGQFVEAPHDLLIGVRRGTRYASTRARLPEGSTLIAYTDGLIERRAKSIDDSLTDLLLVASSVAERTVHEICEQLLHVAAGSDVDDDITVVAIQFEPDRDLESPPKVPLPVTETVRSV